MSKLFEMTATTLLGLENTLAQELIDLGAKNVQTSKHLVAFEGDKKLLYKANLHCRTAIRILKPIEKFFAYNEEELYRKIQKTKWSKYLNVKKSLAIDPIVHNSTFKHSLYVAQLTKDAIVDQFKKHTGKRPSVDLENPDLRLNLYMNKNNIVLSLDSSGDSLHKRGYRIQTNTVPLNEVLAAGIIALSGWDKKSNFIDPMCGSGTFLIEAALLALNRIPGFYRKEFAFMHWKDYDFGLYQDLIKQAKEQEKKSCKFTILGSDVNKKAFGIASKNVQNAHLEHIIKLEHRPFEEQTPPQAPGILIMNPPYNARQEAKDLENKYKMIGDTLKQKYPGYTGHILTGNLKAAKRIGLKPSRRIELYNGALECRLLKFEMYAGSKR